MSDCFLIGINGGCGDNCPLLLRGECGCESTFLERIKEELDKKKRLCYNSNGGNEECQQQKQME